MLVQMLDTTTPGAIGRLASTSPDAIAGYIDGRYRDLTELEKLYPNHHHLSIVVTADDDGDCLDIENGDATPAQAPGWVLRQRARGHARPWLYANSSTWPTVEAYLQRSGISRPEVVKWRADFDQDPNLLPDDDAKQYTDHWQGRNVDASMVRSEVFDLPLPRHGAKPRPRHRPVRVPRPRKPIHPKVKGATAGSAIATGILALLHALGVNPITPAEAAGAASLGAIIAGYLTPSKQ